MDAFNETGVGQRAKPRVVKAAAVRRLELLDIAQRLFLERGYERTTVNDVIDAAGVSKGAFYHHFRAKEDLLEAIAERMARQSLEHSFLPGQSLWADTKLIFRTAPACGGDPLGAEQPSASCQQFLQANERARTQWRLETEFTKFEKNF